LDQGALATWALVATSLLAAGLVVWQLRDGTRARRDQNAILVKQETLRMFIATLDHRTPQGLPFPSDDDAAGVSEFIRRAANEPLVERAITRYLNYWELVAAGDIDGQLDDELLQRLSRSRVLSVWANYEPFISRGRELSGSDLPWHELQTLATQWARQEKRAAA
jgi:hypothetical protein